ncbi:MAG: hypothetical protein DMD43_02150 [Gemmatimonadetes bacterium]|nr:MAG: hypothetical protein DMD43_02150 [Gemmatimonadota bacterium]
MADKLTARQQSQLALLRTLQPRFEQMHRLIEEIAGLRADDSVVRRLCRLLDATRAAADGVGLNAMAETMGVMGTMARRGGGMQMKIQGLRDGLRSLKINFEGAVREASTGTPQDDAEKPAEPPASAS